MKKNLLIMTLLGLTMVINSEAQNYTDKIFSIQTTKTELVYGISKNYLGINDTLKLNIYKPTGNTNSQRPLLVLNHGGAWIAGDKTDASIVQLAGEFVRRGYVVASVNYRLGIHKANWASNPFPKNVNEGFHAVYTADSAEIYRALYRAVQDIKGAIRFMKSRHAIDSTCADAVFIGGESAGGFNAMALAFMDINSEKPGCCSAIADVPMPQGNLLDNYPSGTVTSTQLKRPDLGEIEGTLNLNGYNAKVKGVLNLFGGFLAEAVSKSWISGNDSLSIYMTHQSCDGIVPCNAAICLSPMSINCNLGYTPFHNKWPLSYGSCALRSYFTGSTPKVKKLKTEIFNCDPIVFPLTDCIRYAQNGSYHYTVNVFQRCDSMAKFLAPIVKFNIDYCKTTGSIKSKTNGDISISPNPSNGTFSIDGISYKQYLQIEIFDLYGKKIDFEQTSENQFTCLNIPNHALMTLALKTEEGCIFKKISIQK